MRKDEQLSVVFASVYLGVRFPIVGIDREDQGTRYDDLRRLAVIVQDAEGERILTDFGREVRRHSLELRLGLLQAVCARFDLGWHGRIAAAYVAAQCGAFIKHTTGGPTAGL